ncbi:MAG: hypothetical protein AB7F86_05730 [Bdellovibrionales bacterium]
MKKIASLLIFALVTVFSTLSFAEAKTYNLSVEGLVLGFFPHLGDGVQVQPVEGSNEIRFAPASRCIEIKRVESLGSSFHGLTFLPESRRVVRNKMTGLMGYPGLSSDSLADDWLRSAKGLAFEYYRDNVAVPPPENTVQVLFVPVVLAPRPLVMTSATMTAAAKEMLDRGDWASLEKACGTHFVEVVGEENFVIYSTKVEFSNSEERRRFDLVQSERDFKSPAGAFDTLEKLRQSLFLDSSPKKIIIDVLQVGGRPPEVSGLHSSVERQKAKVEIHRLSKQDTVISRISKTCDFSELRKCQEVATAVLDYQFNRLTYTGDSPAFAPVRLRLVPIRHFASFYPQ